MRMTRILAITAFAVLAVATVGCDDGGDGALVSDDPSATTYDYDYYIPAGTAERMSSGEQVEILPAILDVRVGEVIRIVNDDDTGHSVGIFFVGAHETVTQRFTSKGEFIGSCSVHPSRQFTLRVGQ